MSVGEKLKLSNRRQCLMCKQQLLTNKKDRSPIEVANRLDGLSGAEDTQNDVETSES